MLDTGWTFSHMFVVKNCIVCLKRTKINEKEAIFFKKNVQLYCIKRLQVSVTKIVWLQFLHLSQNDDKILSLEGVKN